MGPEGLSGMQQGLGALWTCTWIPVVHGRGLEQGRDRGRSLSHFAATPTLLPQDEADPKRQKTENGASA